MWDALHMSQMQQVEVACKTDVNEWFIGEMDLSVRGRRPRTRTCGGIVRWSARRP